MASETALFCLGCGAETDRASDRRNLGSSPSKSVLNVWMTVVTRKLEVDETDEFIQSLVTNHRMCRKCYSSYEKLLRLQKGIEDNINEALDMLLPTARLDTPADDQAPPLKRPPLPRPPIVIANPMNPESRKSPVVSVSLNNGL